MITHSALGAIPHGFFTRDGGVSEGLYASLNCGLGSGDAKERVRENRRRVGERLGVEPRQLVTAWQHHSADVLTVAAPWDTEQPPKADGLVTASPGLALGVLTADCAPLLFVDPQACVIAAAHAGWKGALTGVAEATIAAMEKLGAKRARIAAVIGPTISQAAYETGPEFIARFIAADAANRRYFQPSEKSGHHFFDLPGYLLARLERAGIGLAENTALCTYADPERFFSYRRTTHAGEPDYGRQIAAIAIAPVPRPDPPLTIR